MQYKPHFISTLVVTHMKATVILCLQCKRVFALLVFVWVQRRPMRITLLSCDITTKAKSGCNTRFEKVSKVVLLYNVNSVQYKPHFTGHLVVTSQEINAYSVFALQACLRTTGVLVGPEEDIATKVLVK